MCASLLVNVWHAEGIWTGSLYSLVTITVALRTLFTWVRKTKHRQVKIDGKTRDGFQATIFDVLSWFSDVEGSSSFDGLLVILQRINSRSDVFMFLCVCVFFSASFRVSFLGSLSHTL